MVDYCDAHYMGHNGTWRSTTGYTFLLYCGATNLNNKKQPTIALSTAQTQYIATTHITKKAIWLQWFFIDIGFSKDGTMIIYSDN